MRALLVALLTLAAQPLFAQNVPPSEDSVRHLLDLMQTHRVLDKAWANMDGFMQKAMEQARQGQTVNAKQQQILDQFHSDMMSAMHEGLAWSKVEPGIVAAYQKTFSQKEVNDLSAFYSSPNGQSIASKLPLVSQQMSADMQQRMVPLIQRMQQSARDMQARLKEAGEGESQPAAH